MTPVLFEGQQELENNQINMVSGLDPSQQMMVILKNMTFCILNLLQIRRECHIIDMTFDFHIND
jgi:hypothetical protein